MMISVIVTPFRYFGYKLERQRLVERKLHRAFACFVFRKSFAEMLNSLIAGVQPDVPFECRKVDNIPFTPVSRHTP
jgi:hypothetical protein